MDQFRRILQNAHNIRIFNIEFVSLFLEIPVVIAVGIEKYKLIFIAFFCYKLKKDCNVIGFQIFIAKCVFDLLLEKTEYGKVLPTT